MIIRRKAARNMGNVSIITSFWSQILAIFALAVLAPAVIFYQGALGDGSILRPLINSMIGATLAAFAGLIFVRRVTAYPGARAFGFVLPSFAATYATVVTIFFAVRIDYGRLYFASSFFVALLVSYVINLVIEQYSTLRFYVVPFGDVEDLLHIDKVEWVIIDTPEVPSQKSATIVADLRYDFSPEWDRMLAEAAVAGHTVYHSKQLGESLTGRVSISHMSENSFGSLVPNLGYRKAKRVIDVIGAIVLIPLLVIPFVILSVLIMIDSPGGAFFKQKRMGFRGKEFAMIKFRTMRPHVATNSENDARHSAITQSDDARITRIGKILRRSRLDELPQVFNVLAGQMSFIGPRPEAIALSKWYEQELAFYLYRHIVRPGITGWAQVNQGHVADLDSVGQKLNYDFFYIKNFSSWLDVLIVFKTLRTIITGFGSK